MGILDKILRFRRVEEKAVQYTYMGGYGQPKYNTALDKQYVSEAYNRIVWVYACIGLISACVSQVKWCLYRNSINGNKIEIDNHPILNLINCNANHYTSSRDFFEIWATYLAIQGKFYGLYNSPVMPTSIEYLYPHETKPIPNLEKFVEGYEYNVNGSVYRYNSELVMWSKFFDPIDAYSGLSPIRAIARTIDTENEAIDWNKTSLQNNAVPPGIIQVTNPSPELSQKLREDWISRYSGANNARVPLILNSEKASYTAFGMSPVDMDFIEQRKMNRVEICAAFNVPSQLVGDPQGQTYSNYKEALKSLWENTIIPRYLSNIEACLNNDLAIRFSDNLIIKADLDDIEALQDNRETKIKNTTLMYEKGIITRGEAREALDYESSNSDNVYIQDVKLPGKQTKLDEFTDSIKKKVYY